MAPETNPLDTYPRPLPFKLVQDPMHLELPGSYDNNIEESSSSDETTPEQEFRFAVLFKQWVRRPWSPPKSV